MYIKVFGANEKQFNSNLNEVLNVSALICAKGYIPGKEELANGWLWVYEFHGTDRYNIVPSANDYWMNVKSRTETSITLWLNCRYDTDNEKATSIENVLAAFFPYSVELLNEE